MRIYPCCTDILNAPVPPNTRTPYGVAGSELLLAYVFLFFFFPFPREVILLPQADTGLLQASGCPRPLTILWSVADNVTRAPVPMYFSPSSRRMTCVNKQTLPPQ